MIKIKMCDIPESNVTWDYYILDDTDLFTKRNPVTKISITKPANQWNQDERPYIKSEVTLGTINGFDATRKALITQYKNSAILAGKKVIKETNHAIIFDNGSIESIEIPCPQDITKLKTELGL